MSLDLVEIVFFSFNILIKTIFELSEWFYFLFSTDTADSYLKLFLHMFGNFFGKWKFWKIHFNYFSFQVDLNGSSFLFEEY